MSVRAGQKYPSPGSSFATRGLSSDDKGDHRDIFSNPLLKRMMIMFLAHHPCLNKFLEVSE